MDDLDALAQSLIQARQTGRAVSRELAKTAPSGAPKITPFPDPYQTLVVPINKTKQVFYFKVPMGHVGFIQYVANNYYADTFLYWYIDGRLVISPNIEYALAFVNTPKRIEPWLKVKEEIRWNVSNVGSEDREFEILCDGFYVPEEEVSLLLKLNLPISR